MRIKTHEVIGRVISRYLNLDPYLEEYFIRGLRRPDLGVKWRRKERRVRSHHNIHPETIMNIIWSARRAYLAGNYEDSLGYLGIALHYVQDKCVVRARKRFRRIHDKVERTVTSLEIPVEAIREGFEKTECSAIFVKSILYSIKPSTDPTEVLRNACYYSAVIMGAVYNPSKPPQDLLKRYEEVKVMRMRKRRLKRSLILTLALIFCGLFILYPHLLTIYFIIIFLLTPLLLINGIDYRLREELAWYGLE
jgi:uncharacterized membrane protein YiaA